MTDTNIMFGVRMQDLVCAARIILLSVILCCLSPGELLFYTTVFWLKQADLCTLYINQSVEYPVLFYTHIT